MAGNYHPSSTTRFTGTSADDSIQLEDLAKFYDYQGNVPTVLEVMSEQNHILPHMMMKASMGDMQEWQTFETHLPEAQDVYIGRGSKAVKGNIARHVEEMNELETRTKVDVRLLKYAPGRGRAIRTTQERQIVRGMSHQIARRLFYGNQATGRKQIDGIATRLHSKAEKNVWSEGGAGSALTSVYFVKWSTEDGLYCFYPRNHNMMGIEVEDLGQQTVMDTYGDEYEVMRSRFGFVWGLFVADPRNVHRYGGHRAARCRQQLRPRDRRGDPELRQQQPGPADVLQPRRHDAARRAADIQSERRALARYAVGHAGQIFHGLPAVPMRRHQ